MTENKEVSPIERAKIDAGRIAISDDKLLWMRVGARDVSSDEFRLWSFEVSGRIDGNGEGITSFHDFIHPGDEAVNSGVESSKAISERELRMMRW